MDGDLGWLGLQRHEGGWSLEVTPPLARFDGKLYGGTGLALAVATMEAASDRAAQWTTVQFVGSADVGERLDCRVDVVAAGRRTAQVQMTALCAGRLVLSALGSTGDHRDGALEVEIPRMPVVPGPEAGTNWGAGWQDAQRGWTDLVEMRQVELGSGRFAVWGRMRDGTHTRATVAFMADLVPSAVVRAAGRIGAGTSLDNSMRFGRFVATDWVLLDFDPWFATGGYVNGGARVWAEDGTLLGYASQTASELVRDPSAPGA